MIIWNENMELYEEERAEFEIDDQDDDFAISLPLFEINRIILEDKNYDTFEISSDESQEPSEEDLKDVVAFLNSMTLGDWEKLHKEVEE